MQKSKEYQIANQSRLSRKTTISQFKSWQDIQKSYIENGLEPRVVNMPSFNKAPLERVVYAPRFQDEYMERVEAKRG